LQDTPVRGAIKALFDQLRGTGLDYVFEGDVEGKITLDISNVPYTDALATILRTANLTARLENGVYMIIPSMKLRPAMAVPGIRRDPPAGISISPSPSGPGAATTFFDISLDGANVYQAIVQLMTMTKRNYVFDLGMTGQAMSAYAPRVSAVLKRVPFDQALDMIGKASGLAVEKIGVSYVIRQIRPALGANTQSPKSTPGQFRCPRCSSPLSVDWNFCPMCGAQVQSVPELVIPGKGSPSSRSKG
jgi:hypothetical protein